MLLRMVFVLGAVCTLAYVLLKWGLKRFVVSGTSGGAMEVVARLAVEPRRTILVVRIGETEMRGDLEEGLLAQAWSTVQATEPPPHG